MSAPRKPPRNNVMRLTEEMSAPFIEKFGKLPPQAVDLEETVLGALMLDRDAMERIAEILPEEAFYKESNQLIYKACKKLFTDGSPIDIVTVTKECRNAGNLDIVGGPYYITSLTNRVGSAAHIETHARIISEKHIQRELIRVSTDITRESYDDGKDVFELLDYAERSLFGIAESSIAKQTEHAATVALRTIKQIQSVKDHGNGLSGIASGFTGLDRITNGWQDNTLIIIAGRPGMGKCKRIGTKVIMYDGSIKKVEDIAVGDLLMGDDSKPRKVLSLGRGREMMYWVRQNKGIDYSVNESHILSLKASGTEGSRIHGETVNISVKDYIKKSRKFQVRHKGYKVAIEFASKPLPVEPYFIGAWLGDGDKVCTNITKDEKELTEYLQSYANRIDMKLYTRQHADKKCKKHSIVRRNGIGKWSLYSEIRKMNLLNNKHIPNDYLINSTENRLQLLAGLLDTDGSIWENCFEITQKSHELSKQIKFLCDSLGFRTCLTPKKGKIKSIGFEGQYYRLHISGNIDIIPTKILRKQGKPYKPNKDWRVTGITIEKDKVDDYYGFELDGNGLYLLEDCTVTHNTSFALTCMINAAKYSEKPVAIFSLEMESTELMQRLLSAEAEIDADKFKSGKLSTNEWEQLGKAVNKIGAMPIYIDDTAALSMFQLRAKARRLKSQYGVGMIFVDYLQLMRGDENSKAGNREQEISYISRSLKALSKELCIPVMVLASMNREVDKRAGARLPQLSDIRESGSIESDADIVIFVNRPEKNGITEDPEGHSLIGIADVIVAKHRSGPTDTVRLRFKGEFTKFSDIYGDAQFVDYKDVPPVEPVQSDNWSRLPDRRPSDDEPF